MALQHIAGQHIGNRQVAQRGEDIYLDTTNDLARGLRLPMPEHGAVPLAGNLLERVLDEHPRLAGCAFAAADRILASSDQPPCFVLA